MFIVINGGKIVLYFQSHKANGIGLVNWWKEDRIGIGDAVCGI